MSEQSLRLVIVADDLTGANDTGAVFAGRGVATAVTPVWRAQRDPAPGGCAVWVVNTESRHLSPGQAEARVAAAVDDARRQGASLLYKKTDSTLRGNIGGELAAAQQAWGRGPLIYVPALPSAGRVVRDGILWVNGTPVSETSFARDPLAPVKTSSLLELVSGQTTMPTRLVTLDQLRGCGIELRGTDELVMVEGETDADLALTMQQLGGREGPTCWAGTAGFAVYLHQALGFSAPTPAPTPRRRPILVVNGSLNPVAIEQLSHATAAGFRLVELDPDALIGEGGGRYAAADADSVAGALAEGRDMVLTVRPRGRGRSRDITAGLARLTRDLVQENSVGTLMVFGGETAQAIFRALDCQCCRLRDEIVLGVALLEADVDGRPLQIITKSGGFGPPDLLGRIRT